MMTMTPTPGRITRRRSYETRPPSVIVVFSLCSCYRWAHYSDIPTLPLSNII